MNKGSSMQTCVVTIYPKTVKKQFNDISHTSFLNELYVYLLAEKKKLSYIPKMVKYDIEKRIIVIENIGKSLDIVNEEEGTPFEEFLPKIKKIYTRFLKLGLHHNDLRWKNIIYNEKLNRYYLIDFEFASPKFTDKDHDKIVKNIS